MFLGNHRGRAERASRRASRPEGQDAASARVATPGPHSARPAERSLQPPPPPPLLLRHLGRHLDSTPLPPPAPAAAAAEAAPAPAPPPSGGMGGRLPPLAERGFTSVRASWSPRVVPRPGGGGSLERRRDRTQRAAPRTEPAGPARWGPSPGVGEGRCWPCHPSAALRGAAERRQSPWVWAAWRVAGSPRLGSRSGGRPTQQSF